jgi:hypothetical protein
LKNLTKLVLMIAAVSLLLAACRPAATVVPTETQVDPNLVYTAAAETAQVRLTENAAVTPTLPPATLTPEPSPTMAATSTPEQVATTVEATPPPTSAAQPTGGDNAVYVQDVTIPDGTVLGAGESFVKTWKIMNSGTTTWTTAYSLVHISDNLMGAENSVPLTVEVPPNQNVDISVNMVAPSANGSYRGFWRMRNAQGQLFGDAIYVDIRVGSGASSTQSPTATVAGPTATSAPSSSATVSNLSVTVENPTTTAACPHSYRVEANFNLSAPGAVTYKWEAGSDTPGFTFTLPDSQTMNFTTGTQTLAFFLELNNSGSGWIQLHITSPQDIVTNQATFSLTCE